MNDKIAYDLESTLSAPDSGSLSAIMVTVEIEPPSASCLIYGWQSDGNLGFIQVGGAKTEVELPFCRPQIFVKYLQGLQNLKIHTRGYVDTRK